MVRSDVSPVDPDGRGVHPITWLVRTPIWRALSVFAAAFLAFWALAWIILRLTTPDIPVQVGVRWKPDVAESDRVALERRFQLRDGTHQEGTTWEYFLDDTSLVNVRALVQDARVDDTAAIDRSVFRPIAEDARARERLIDAAAAGAAGAFLLLALAASIRRPALIHFPSPVALVHAFSARPSAVHYHVAVHAERAPPTYFVTTAVAAMSVLASLAMARLAGTRIESAAMAIGIVYVAGFVVGALVVHRRYHQLGRSWVVIRIVAGLLLTSTAFLLSLTLSLPWFLGPAAVIAAAVLAEGPGVFWWPSAQASSPDDQHARYRIGWDNAGAAVLVIAILSPTIITAFRMAPGEFPPAFYNADTPYFLEKVHALLAADGYPPPSLSNLGGVRTYHFGTHAMTALIARASGLLPHHALFLIVLPLLVAGVAASAVAAARQVSASLPRTLAVPLLLVSVPPLTVTHWGELGPHLRALATSAWDSASIPSPLGPYELWGIVSNEGQNLGGDFVILASIAAIAAAPQMGWRLPAFLVGTAVLIKTTTGLALLAGFGLAESWRAIAGRRLVVSPQLLLTGAVFGLTYLFFWVLPQLDSEFRLEIFPLYHLRYIAIDRGSLPGLLVDLVWLLLPVLVVLVAARGIARGDRASLFLYALAPLVVVNTIRMIDIRPGMAGPDEDWLQLLHTTPFFLHALALSLASQSWARLRRGWRVAFAITVALVIAPVAASAAHYSQLLLREPARGNDFVDNRALAEALRVIPARGTILVTNDLRYPADDFARDNRQMQIPALFGHQTFGVNYAYEVFAFSGERRQLQALLQRPDWSDAILDAARVHGWTHLVIHKDAVHPAPNPLERVFENEAYAVFVFP